MLAVADARSFLLTASQIIPTLLVALFVLDRRLTIPQEAEVESLEKELKESERVHEGAAVKYREKTLYLLSITMSVHWLQRAIAESNLRGNAELAAKLEWTTRRYASMSSDYADDTDEFLASQKTLASYIERLARVKKRMRSRNSQYRVQFAIAIVSATVSEGFALLGSVGIVNVYSAVAVALAVIGLALITLVDFVFARFFPGLDEAVWERRAVNSLRTILIIAYAIYLFKLLTAGVK